MKYVHFPRATVDSDGEADASLSLARTVIEADRAPADTGLVDKRGLKLYRVAEERPSGFFAKWK